VVIALRAHLYEWRRLGTGCQSRRRLPAAGQLAGRLDRLGRRERRRQQSVNSYACDQSAIDAVIATADVAAVFTTNEGNAQRARAQKGIYKRTLAIAEFGLEEGKQ
jgi:hypothetical protein